jgi:hypothetical protein
MLVGAVGIENNTDRNFKDLEEMLGTAKELKRNNRECKGILIGPSMAPHFSGAEIPLLFLRSTKSGVGFRSNLAARMASRRPTFQEMKVNPEDCHRVLLRASQEKTKRIHSRVWHGKMPCLEAS